MRCSARPVTVRGTARPCGPGGAHQREVGGDPGAVAAGAADLDPVGEIGDQRHAEADARAVGAGTQAEAVVGHRDLDALVVERGGHVHAAGPLAVAVRVQDGVRHRLGDDHADRVAVDRDAPQRLEHGAPRARHALGLGREIHVEQVGRHTFSYARTPSAYTRGQESNRALSRSRNAAWAGLMRSRAPRPAGTIPPGRFLGIRACARIAAAIRARSVLERTAAASRSPSSAHACTTLPDF